MHFIPSVTGGAPTRASVISRNDAQRPSAPPSTVQPTLNTRPPTGSSFVRMPPASGQDADRERTAPAAEVDAFLAREAWNFLELTELILKLSFRTPEGIGHIGADVHPGKQTSKPTSKPTDNTPSASTGISPDLMRLLCGLKKAIDAGKPNVAALALSTIADLSAALCRAVVDGPWKDALRGNHIDPDEARSAGESLSLLTDVLAKRVISFAPDAPIASLLVLQRWIVLGSAARIFRPGAQAKDVSQRVFNVLASGAQARLTLELPSLLLAIQTLPALYRPRTGLVAWGARNLARQKMLSGWLLNADHLNVIGNAAQPEALSSVCAFALHERDAGRLAAESGDAQQIMAGIVRALTQAEPEHFAEGGGRWLGAPATFLGQLAGMARQSWSGDDDDTLRLACRLVLAAANGKRFRRSDVSVTTIAAVLALIEAVDAWQMRCVPQSPPVDKERAGGDHASVPPRVGYAIEFPDVDQVLATVSSLMARLVTCTPQQIAREGAATALRSTLCYLEKRGMTDPLLVADVLKDMAEYGMTEADRESDMRNMTGEVADPWPASDSSLFGETAPAVQAGGASAPCAAPADGGTESAPDTAGVRGEDSHDSADMPWITPQLVRSREALNDAIERSDENTVTAMLRTSDSAALVVMPDSVGDLPLHRAVILPSASLAASLLLWAPVRESAGTPNADGWTPLMLAIRAGKNAIAHRLLELPSVHETLHQRVSMPAMHASLRHASDRVAMDRTYGRMVDGLRYVHRDALALAIEHTNEDVARALMRTPSIRSALLKEAAYARDVLGRACTHDVRLLAPLLALPGMASHLHVAATGEDAPFIAIVAQGNLNAVRECLEQGERKLLLQLVSSRGHDVVALARESGNSGLVKFLRNQIKREGRRH